MQLGNLDRKCNCGCIYLYRYTEQTIDSFSFTLSVNLTKKLVNIKLHIELFHILRDLYMMLLK